MKTDRLEKTKALVATLCNGTPYSPEGGMVDDLAHALARLPVWAVGSLKLLVELKDQAFETAVAAKKGRRTA